MVDEHLATGNAPCHAELACAVAAPDAGHQPEGRAVGQRDGFVLAVKGHGAKHRAKNFFLRQPVLWRHIAQQRGRLVKA